MKLAEIETTRLYLRPLTTDDVDDIHRLWIDPYIRKYLWDDEVITRERVASIIDASLASFADNGFGLWAVFPGGEQTLIGFCGFWFFHDPPQLQLLYGIAPKEWGKGLAAEVARSMIRYGFEELGFDRIEASTDAANGASLRVMEKAGMVYEKRIYKGGLDTVCCAITREKYQANNLYYFVTMNSSPETMERKTTSIRIRIAVADDAPSIAAVLHESFLEYESSYTQEAFIATTPAGEQIQNRMKEGPIWVALQDDTIVGTVAAVPKGEALYIRGMAILPTARGQRVGEFLLKQIESFASERGFKRLYLSTTPFLRRAIRLYEHYGFRHSSEGAHDLFGTPLVTMEKFLDSSAQERGA